MKLTSTEIRQLLQLTPPTTCGYVCEPYRSDWQLPQSVLPAGYEGSRPLGNVFYFLVTPEAPVQLHRIRSDQVYHHYLGDRLEVLLLYTDGRCEVRIVGTDLTVGERPALFIPGGTFHTARVVAGGEYSLLGTSVWLRAEPQDVEMGDAAVLRAKFAGADKYLHEFGL